MRTAVIERNTKETQIKIEFNLDGGAVQVSTGVGFFDHMLTALRTTRLRIRELPWVWLLSRLLVIWAE